VQFTNREFELLSALAERPNEAIPIRNCTGESGASPNFAAEPATPTSRASAKSSVLPGRQSRSRASAGSDPDSRQADRSHPTKPPPRHEPPTRRRAEGERDKPTRDASLHNRDTSTDIIPLMTNVLPITDNGQLVATVLRDRAIIATDLTPEHRQTVEAMCVYAGEILEVRITKPYGDEDALAYADALAAERLGTSQPTGER
jgi:hypothetical protein